MGIQLLSYKYIEVTSLLQLDSQKRRKSERKRKETKAYNDRAV